MERKGTDKQKGVREGDRKDTDREAERDTERERQRQGEREKRKQRGVSPLAGGDGHTHTHLCQLGGAAVPTGRLGVK